MNKAVEAIYDGTVFRPTELIKMKPHIKVLITVKSTPSKAPKSSFINTAMSLKLEGPADWSANLEDYLYNKKSNEA